MTANAQFHFRSDTNENWPKPIRLAVIYGSSVALWSVIFITRIAIF